jgi:hypothetical protein
MNTTNNKTHSIYHTNKKDMKNVVKYPDIKGLYIARPKREVIKTIDDTPVYHAATDASKAGLFVAYPKDELKDATVENAGINLQEGLFIAYPRRNNLSVDDKAEPSVQSNRIEGRSLYKSQSKFMIENVLNAPKTLLQRNTIVVSLIQLIRRKVS